MSRVLLFYLITIFAVAIVLVTITFCFCESTTQRLLSPSQIFDVKMGGGGEEYRSVAYFVNWAIYGRNHNPQDLPADKLTHVLYAFANVKPDSGEIYLTDTWSDTDKHYPADSWNDVGTNLYGCLKQLNLLKKKNRHLKVLLSIGGWTYSSNFPPAASTEAGRCNFAATALSLVKNLGLDGIDIDWEYPKTPQEAQDLVFLLRECRKALDTHGNSLSSPYHFELTVACPAGSQNYEKMDLKGMNPYLDFWNLMAYDFAGSWDTNTGHQANLFKSRSNPASTPFSIDEAVNHYVSQGIKPDKIVIGMPIYGRAFENTDGLGKTFQGTGQGTWENGVHDFKKLPLPGAEECFDESSGATYCYNRSKKILVSYDTVDMAKRKAEWIKKEGLGGSMWWESSADDHEENSLISNVVKVLGGPDQTGMKKKQNCLDYPESKYENLKKGFPGE